MERTEAQCQESNNSLTLKSILINKFMHALTPLHKFTQLDESLEGSSDKPYTVQ